MFAYLNFKSGETPLFYNPIDSASNDLVAGVDVIDEFGDDPSVYWRSVSTDPSLPSGEAQWADSTGTAIANAQLLIAGLLLGIATSVILEFALEALRDRNR